MSEENARGGGCTHPGHCFAGEEDGRGGIWGGNIRDEGDPSKEDEGRDVEAPSLLEPTVRQTLVNKGADPRRFLSHTRIALSDWLPWPHCPQAPPSQTCTSTLSTD